LTVAETTEDIPCCTLLIFPCYVNAFIDNNTVSFFRVSDHSTENKMSAENLALCWYNTLFRPDMEANNTAMSLPKPIYKDVLENCINQCGFMFYDQQEVSLPSPTE